MNGQEMLKFMQDIAENVGVSTEPENVLETYEYDVYQKGKATDWLDLVLRDGTQQEHLISVSGGTELSKYYFSLGYLNTKGVAKGDGFKRITLRTNLDQNITSWLKIGTSTQIVQSDRGGSKASIEEAFYMTPWSKPFEDDGSLTIYPRFSDVYFGNPLSDLLSVQDNLEKRILSNNFLKVDVPFIKGLFYQLNAGINISEREEGAYWGRLTKLGLDNNGLAQISNQHARDWTIENIIKYNISYQKHTFDFTGLLSRQSYEMKTSGIQGRNFVNDAFEYHQINTGQSINAESSLSEWDLISYMARVNYNYNEKYLLTLTARNDGYSAFSEGNKYGFFPSMALGWNISEESFMKSIALIDHLKVRGSYGLNGNQAITPYASLSQLTSFPYIDGNNTAVGFIPSRLANENLGWENTKSLDIGLDFGLWEGKLQGSIDYYNTNTEDLLLRRSIASTHGISSVVDNIGQTQNSGIDIGLTASIISDDNFNWNINTSFSANRNKISRLYGDGEDDIGNGWFIGKSLNTNYGYKIEGVWQANEDIENSHMPSAAPGDVKYTDINGDGILSAEDRTFFGNSLPDYILGVSNEFIYKSFTLTAFIHAISGVTKTNPLLDLEQTWVGRRNMIKTDWWTPDNPSHSYPAPWASNPRGASYYEDASFIRLKDVTIAYAFKEGLLKKAGFEQLSIFLTGRNLLTLTSYTGTDPELNNQRYIPLSKIYMVGVQVGL
jgi:TonB-linked SusC/RagA family outer membrane protein